MLAEETFLLTQLSAPSFSRQDSARQSSESLPSLKSPRTQVQDRLRDTQSLVKRSFDALYTTRRHQLLPKAMELERSASVQDQLRTLETHVVGKIKAYNALQSRRNSKEAMLGHLNRELEGLRSGVPDLSPATSAMEDVERKHQYAQRQFQRELDYTEVLEHKIVCLSRDIFKRQQPIYGLRKDLQQVKLRLHEGEADSLRISLESQSLWTTIHRKQEELHSQTDFHSHRLQDKVAYYRKRAEFVEFCERQQQQKELETLIHQREREMRQLTAAMAKSADLEEMAEASKAHLDKLHAYERQGETLARAASAGNLQAVLLYWHYLQDFAQLLQAIVLQNTSRIEDLRAKLLLLRTELVETTLGLNSENPVSKSQLFALDKRLESKEKDIAEKLARLTQREQSVAAVRSRLEYLWSCAGGQEKEMTVTELMECVEQQLVQKFNH